MARDKEEKKPSEGRPVERFHCPPVKRRPTAIEQQRDGIATVKGFPNQVADLEKIAVSLRVAVQLSDAGVNLRDDGIFGEALVRAGVAGTGHVPMPVDEYIELQIQKPTSAQSFRTTARGLRELYRHLGFMDQVGVALQINSIGRQAAATAGVPLTGDALEFWRSAIRDMTHTDDQGSSHPYQMLLRLVARNPGITRAQCALALEARNDSIEELDRISRLVSNSELDNIELLGVSKSTWDNAKKVLPKFAEQLGDVIKTNQSYIIADTPGSAKPSSKTDPRIPADTGTRVPRSSRRVDVDSIANAGLGENDEPPPPPDMDPVAAANAIAARANRLRRHNLLVKDLTKALTGKDVIFFEDPFDILAQFSDNALLIEVKSLDEDKNDEIDRVRSSLAQLLYYEAFITVPISTGASIQKVACFERKPTDAHIDWLFGQNILAIWKSGNTFSSDARAKAELEKYMAFE